MNFIDSVKSRIPDKPDSERRHAIVRLVAGLAASAYCLPIALRAENRFSLPGQALFLLYVCIMSAWIYLKPQASDLRRYLGAFADMASLTLAMILLGELGLAVYGLFIWVTAANGFRFRSNCLLVALASGIAGLSIACAVSPAMQGRVVLGAALVIIYAGLSWYFHARMKELFGSACRADPVPGAGHASLAGEETVWIRRHPHERNAGHPVRSWRVIVADGNEPDLDTIRGILKERGHQVIGCGSAHDILNVLSGQHVDLIIIDMDTEAWDGIALIKMIRSLPRVLGLIPIVMLTGCAADAGRRKAMDAGAVAFFTKPIDTEALLERILCMVPSEGPEKLFAVIERLNRLAQKIQDGEDADQLMEQRSPHLFWPEIIRQYLREAKFHIEALEECVRGNDHAQWLEELGRFKGRCMSLGLIQLALVLERARGIAPAALAETGRIALEKIKQAAFAAEAALSALD